MSSSSSPDTPPPTTSSWWNSLSWWRSVPSSIPKEQVFLSEAIPSTSKSCDSTVSKVDDLIEEDVEVLSGWEAVKKIYTDRSNMEADIIQRATRMSFVAGFLVGGANQYAQAKQQYEMNNVGRKYLSPSDSVKRRVDYAIVRFARGGFSMGLKTAFITGSILIVSTHVTAYRHRFSSWYFPVFSGAVASTLHSALVGGIFTFPTGLIGSCKAFGLGISSGLTLSAVVHLYALGIDKTVDQSYWLFKKDYEKELRVDAQQDERVCKIMQEEGIRWKATAMKRMIELDEEKLKLQDA